MEIINTFIEQASNIWWGIVAAIVVTAVLYIIIYILQGGSKSFTPLRILFAVPLLPLLAFQFYLLFGAMSVKHRCSEVAVWIDTLVPAQSADGGFSREEVDEALNQLISVFPLATTWIEPEDIATDKGNTLGEALTNKIHTYLNWFIVRRVAWSMGFMLLAVVGIMFTQPTKASHRSSQHRERRYQSRPSRRSRR